MSNKDFTNPTDVDLETWKGAPGGYFQVIVKTILE